MIVDKTFIRCPKKSSPRDFWERPSFSHLSSQDHTGWCQDQLKGPLQGIPDSIGSILILLHLPKRKEKKRKDHYRWYFYLINVSLKNFLDFAVLAWVTFFFLFSPTLSLSLSVDCTKSNELTLFWHLPSVLQLPPGKGGVGYKQIHWLARLQTCKQTSLSSVCSRNRGKKNTDPGQRGAHPEGRKALGSWT